MGATTSLNARTAQRKWRVIDLEGQTLGRVATQIAAILRGKDKPTYTPHVDGGDFVIAINAAKIKLTGNKWQTKTYYAHSGYTGGLKEVTAEKIRAKKPEALILKAVKGMLPKSKLSDALLTKLKVFAGGEHPHQAQLEKATSETKRA